MTVRYSIHASISVLSTFGRIEDPIPENWVRRLDIAQRLIDQMDSIAAVLTTFRLSSNREDLRQLAEDVYQTIYDPRGE